ncbi:MAG: RNA polymerase sigma factor [Bacteroidales bacterium]
MNEGMFLELLENNKTRILRICSVYSRSDEEKKDMYQEVTINLWKSLPAFKGNSSLSTWVYRVALNTCMRQSLKSKRLSGNHQKLESIHLRTLQLDDDANDKQELVRQLYKCIGNLNDIDKNLCMLSLDELPYKEITEITGLSENHIAVRMKRLKEKLFNCLNKEL